MWYFNSTTLRGLLSITRLFRVVSGLFYSPLNESGGSESESERSTFARSFPTLGHTFSCQWYRVQADICWSKRDSSIPRKYVLIAPARCYLYISGFPFILCTSCFKFFFLPSVDTIRLSYSNGCAICATRLNILIQWLHNASTRSWWSIEVWASSVKTFSTLSDNVMPWYPRTLLVINPFLV